MNLQREGQSEAAQGALLCDDDQGRRAAIQTALETLGYTVDTAEDAPETLEKLKFNQYGVIVLHERFGGGGPADNTVWNHLRHMPMPARRQLFCALVGPTLKTHDQWAAFAGSVHLVVNEADLPQLRTILHKAITDNDHFYKVYRESLSKRGKQ